MPAAGESSLDASSPERLHAVGNGARGNQDHPGTGGMEGGNVGGKAGNAVRAARSGENPRSDFNDDGLEGRDIIAQRYAHRLPAFSIQGLEIMAKGKIKLIGGRHSPLGKVADQPSIANLDGAGNRFDRNTAPEPDRCIVDELAEGQDLRSLRSGLPAPDVPQSTDAVR